MQQPTVCRLTFNGRTGDGKTTLCAKLAEHAGQSEHPFVGDGGAAAHTHEPCSCMCAGGTTMVTDNPGMMDTGGVEKDEQNIGKIVQHERQMGHMNALVIVVNEQAPRFDSGMQDAVKLYVDSFGPPTVRHMGIVFTRADGRRSLQRAQEITADIACMLAKRTGLPIPHLPCWQVECLPEEMAALGVPEERIAATRARTQAALSDLLRWARALPCLDTRTAVVGEYEQRRVAREKAEEAAAAQVRAEAEKKKRLYDASVIKEWEETREVEAGRTSTPIMKGVPRTRQSGIGLAACVIGAAVVSVVGAPELAVPILSASSKVTERAVMGSELAGMSTCVDMLEQRRFCKTFGTGVISYGEWITVRDWKLTTTTAM